MCYNLTKFESDIISLIRSYLMFIEQCLPLTLPRHIETYNSNLKELLEKMFLDPKVLEVLPIIEAPDVLLVGSASSVFIRFTY